jgi:hypothetical protein
MVLRTVLKTLEIFPEIHTLLAELTSLVYFTIVLIACETMTFHC